MCFLAVLRERGGECVSDCVGLVLTKRAWLLLTGSAVWGAGHGGLRACHRAARGWQMVSGVSGVGWEWMVGA